jgi:hypothetical protein
MLFPDLWSQGSRTVPGLPGVAALLGPFECCKSIGSRKQGKWDGILEVVDDCRQPGRVADDKKAVFGKSIWIWRDFAALAGYRRNFPLKVEFQSATPRFSAGNLAEAADYGKNESII